MKLSDLLKILPEYQAWVEKDSLLFLNQDVDKNPRPNTGEISVAGVSQDARQISQGFVYVAIKGTQIDGHQFLQNASDQGAIALVVLKGTSQPPNFQGVFLEVQDTREALQKIASHFYFSPSRALMMMGVTGTNGKTSLTYMIEHVLNKMGYVCGVLGTINHHVKDVVWESTMTTPDPLSLQRRLFEMRALGATAVAMEVSSHALAQQRAHSVDFDRVIFTNLTQDHLDYHQTMDEYFKAKQILFTDLIEKSTKFPIFAIVNIDDEYGKKLRVSSKAGILTYGTDIRADFKFEIHRIDFQGTEFTLNFPDLNPDQPLRTKISLIGQHNVYNTVAVVAAMATMGFLPEKTLKALETFSGVPGRLEKIDNKRNLPVFVDYAHTPDALKNVLTSLQKVKNENALNVKIWTVFGCGGDRDRKKRPLMGRIAQELSDYVILTSDNPRSENPETILSEIREGIGVNSNVQVFQEVDRKKAIEMALRNAAPGDVILVAGKGHEDYQIIGDRKIPFSDQQIIREY